MGHDAVVVGSGAAGGFVASALTEAGFRVLVLEAGEPRLPHELPALDAPLDRSPDFLREASERQAIQLRHACFGRETRRLFVDDLDHPYTTPEGSPFDWIRARQVGGRTLTWGGVTPRFSDFELAAGRYDGLSPSFPVSHAELDPFYREAERAWRVCGSTEGLAQLPDGEFASPRPMTRAELELKRAVEARFPGRRVIPSRGLVLGVPGADGFPLSTSQGSTLARALGSGRLTLRTGAVVHRIETNADGRRATALEVVELATGRRETVPARVVFVCASTIESTRILLSSKGRLHPEGLANSSGALGHYLMDHPSIGVFGRLPAPAREHEPLGGAHGICIPRFQNVGDERAAFARGYSIWGGAARVHPAIPFADCFVLHASAEMLPRYECSVSLDPERVDAWGIPVPHIRCDYADNEHALLEDARERLLEMAGEVGWSVQHVDDPSTPGGWVHELGTARMGDDPRTSVLDPFNCAWDVRNLYVTDGAAFPASGCQNPTLTIAALSLRAAAHAAARLGRGEL